MAVISITSSVENIIDNVIKVDEGGWVLSQDADGGDGGWTFGGITAITYSHHFGSNFSYSAVKNTIISSSDSFNRFKANCITIYVADFTPANFEAINNTTIQSILFSSCINLGVNNNDGPKLLQTALGLYVVDGIIGNGTLGSLKASTCSISSMTDFINKHYLKVWMQRYISICKAKPEKIQFLSGWHNRVEHWRI